MKQIRATEDSLCKRIIGGGSEISQRMLRRMLETFLEMEIHSIEQLSSNVTTGRDEKQMIADVLHRVNGIHFVSIEMQNQYKRDNRVRFVS